MRYGAFDQQKCIATYCSNLMQLRIVVLFRVRTPYCVWHADSLRHPAISMYQEFGYLFLRIYWSINRWKEFNKIENFADLLLIVYITILNFQFINAIKCNWAFESFCNLASELEEDNENFNKSAIIENSRNEKLQNNMKKEKNENRLNYTSFHIHSILFCFNIIPKLLLSVICYECYEAVIYKSFSSGINWNVWKN